MPDLAPETLEPEEPMLLRTPWSATELSDASHEAKLPVALGSNGDGAGAARVVAAKGKRYLSSIVTIVLQAKVVQSGGERVDLLRGTIMILYMSALMLFSNNNIMHTVPCSSVCRKRADQASGKLPFQAH